MVTGEEMSTGWCLTCPVRTARENTGVAVAARVAGLESAHRTVRAARDRHTAGTETKTESEIDAGVEVVIIVPGIITAVGAEETCSRKLLRMWLVCFPLDGFLLVGLILYSQVRRER